MAMVLREAGYRLLSARNGCEVVRVVESRRVDLLITDLMMPEQEGIETILYIRKNYPAIKMIATSGGDPSNLRAARVLGAWATIQKPFSADELVAAVNLVVQRVGFEQHDGSGHPVSRRFAAVRPFGHQI